MQTIILSAAKINPKGILIICVIGHCIDMGILICFPVFWHEVPLDFRPVLVWFQTLFVDLVRDAFNVTPTSLIFGFWKQVALESYSPSVKVFWKNISKPFMNLRGMFTLTLIILESVG
jgi:hypothetical protein